MARGPTVKNICEVGQDPREPKGSEGNESVTCSGGLGEEFRKN